MTSKIMTNSIVKILLAVLISAVSAQVSFGQKSAAAQKKKLVGQLVEKTFKLYPIKGFDDDIEASNKVISGKFKTDIAETIVSKIDANPNFSDEKKAAAKDKIPELTDRLAERLKIIVTGDLNSELWLKDILRQSYAQSLTVADLKKTIAFLDTPGGKYFIDIIKKEADGNGETAKSGAPTDDEIEASPGFVKFANSPTADKFLDSFLTNSSQLLSAKVDAWSVEASKRLDADLKNGEINLLVTEFIKNNFQ